VPFLSDLSLPSTSVVLNIFKRAKNFPIQLEAVLSQSYPIAEVFVWENGEQNVEDVASSFQKVTRVRSDTNLGVWSRFAVALNAKADFIWVIDDDTIPGTKWLENAIETFRNRPAVIGSRGLRFYSSHSYLLYEEFGPNNPSDFVQEVDIVGHNWIFPRHWLWAFWASYPDKFESDYVGEDIHLSYAVQKHLGFGTVVPPHPIDREDMWGEVASSSLFDGTDSAGISAKPGSLKKFENAFQHYISKGFKLISEQEPNSSRANGYRWVGRVARHLPRFVLNAARFVNLKKKPNAE
jgi:glycosyltransferase involved in cell wall biosynthesis